MNKKLLLCCAFIMLCICRVSAQTQWYVVADGKQSVAVSEVEYMLFVDNSEEFSIVKKDGAVIASVMEATFSSEPVSAVDELKNDAFDVSVFPNPVVAELNLKGLRENVTAKVFALDGALVAQAELSAENVRIDVAHLPAGMYVLQVNKTTVKFVKK